MAVTKRTLCIYLPYFPIARRFRKRFDWRNDRLVTVAEVSQARRVVDASPAAIRAGVRRGMTLAEARVLCTDLKHVDHDSRADQRAVEALGRWTMRFTPAVAAGWEADDGEELPPVLFLDMSGCERLFGGIADIVARVTRTLRTLRIPARIAVAPTAGAAWALAAYGEERGIVVDDPRVRESLAELPVAGLRLNNEVLDRLHHLGLRTIGQLYALPREQLPARFGDKLLTRLDQALGGRDELLVPLSYVTAIGTRVRFDFPVRSLEGMWAVFEGLLDHVIAEMVRRGVGARQLEIVCVPDRSTRREATNKEIAISRACRDRKTLWNLIRGSLEQIGCDGEFIAFRLNVPGHERMANGEQIAAFGERDETGEIEVDRLTDRLRLKLGDEAVIRPALVESYLPERAWKGGEEAGPHTKMRGSDHTRSAPLAGVVRPICLFGTPAEIRVVCEPSDDRTGSPRQFTQDRQVHRLAYAVGPERITGEWWRGHDKVRDYYDVEDEEGRRFWIFRVASEIATRWFLHGRFQ